MVVCLWNGWLRRLSLTGSTLTRATCGLMACCCGRSSLWEDHRTLGSLSRSCLNFWRRGIGWTNRPTAHMNCTWSWGSAGTPSRPSGPPSDSWSRITTAFYLWPPQMSTWTCRCLSSSTPRPVRTPTAPAPRATTRFSPTTLSPTSPVFPSSCLQTGSLGHKPGPPAPQFWLWSPLSDELLFKNTCNTSTERLVLNCQKSRVVSSSSSQETP